MNPLQSVFDRLVNLLPKPVFFGLVAITAIILFFWALETRPEVTTYGFLTKPIFITLVSAVVLNAFLYYVVSRHLARPRATKAGRVGVWLARIEGDDGGEYLRNLRGQAEQELAKDPSLRSVDVSVLPREPKSHDEAREEGTRLNAGAVVWGNLGRGLDGSRVGNLKLTVVGGPLTVNNDVQFGRDVDLSGYEMRDVARFVAGYALLSGGRPVEALVHFDRILEDHRPGLFPISDALQFGGIACSMSTLESAVSDELLEKAKRYFARYRDMWPEDSAPKARAMGFFNLAGVQRRGPDVEGIEEALRLYNEASRLFDKASDDEGYAMAQIEVAGILSDLYESQNLAAYATSAHIILDAAKELLNKDDHPHRYARLQVERGRLLARMARPFPTYYEDAIAAFDEALRLYRDLGFPFEAALTLLHRGERAWQPRGTTTRCATKFSTTTTTPSPSPRRRGSPALTPRSRPAGARSCWISPPPRTTSGRPWKPGGRPSPSRRPRSTTSSTPGPAPATPWRAWRTPRCRGSRTKKPRATWRTPCGARKRRRRRSAPRSILTVTGLASGSPKMQGRRSRVGGRISEVQKTDPPYLCEPDALRPKLPGRSPGKVLRLIMMGVGLRGIGVWKDAMTGRLVAAVAPR